MTSQETKLYLDTNQHDTLVEFRCDFKIILVSMEEFLEALENTSIVGLNPNIWTT